MTFNYWCEWKFTSLSINTTNWSILTRKLKLTNQPSVSQLLWRGAILSLWIRPIKKCKNNKKNFQRKLILRLFESKYILLHSKPKTTGSVIFTKDKYTAILRKQENKLSYSLWTFNKISYHANMSFSSQQSSTENYLNIIVN